MHFTAAVGIAHSWPYQASHVACTCELSPAATDFLVDHSGICDGDDGGVLPHVGVQYRDLIK